MDAQTRIGQWGNRTFPLSTPLSIVAHLRREVVELEDEIIRATSPLFETNPGAVQEEAADCLMLLYHLAHRLGFDLHDAAEVKCSINQQRTWGEPDAEGVVEHVKNAPPPTGKEDQG